jgi:hypothetical protein
MDVFERRELTRRLFDHERAYVVVLNGIRDVQEGKFRWHPAYIDFVTQARTESGTNVFWVYLCQDMPAYDKGGRFATAEHRRAVQHIKSLGVDCYLLPLKDASAALNSSILESFF